MRGRRPLLLALAALLAAAAAHAQGSGEPFTPEERRRLQRGELVTRGVTRDEGGFHYVGGTSWQRVAAPVERVWSVVRDPATYPRLIPSLTSVRVVSERGGERLLRMAHEHSFASATYYARVHIDDAHHRMRFELDRSRPHDLRAGRGFITLTPYRGDTIVAWGVLADIGGGVVLQVFGPLLHDWLLKVPLCVRNEVEPGRRGC